MEADDRLEQAKTAAAWMIDDLRAQDRVNVIRFSSDVEAFADVPVALDDDVHARLHAFVRALDAAGSTALGSALDQAARTPRTQGRV